MKKAASWVLALTAVVHLSFVARTQGSEPTLNVVPVNAESTEAGDPVPTHEPDGGVYFWEENGRGHRGTTQLALYFGGARTQSSDLRFRVNGNTDMTYHDVPWFTDAFGMPPYYGIRLSHFFAANPHWGVMLDYTHDKMLAQLDVPLSLTGVRNGIPVNTREFLAQTFSKLQLTDGINFLTANVVYRGFWFTSESRPRGWLQPYVGGGLGVSFPSVETRFIGGPLTHNYQWRGPAFQGMLGTHLVLFQHLSLFGEYKFNNVIINANITGGTQRTVANSHQFLMGPSFNW